MKTNRALIGAWFKHVPLPFLGSEKIHDLYNLLLTFFNFSKI